MRPIAAVEAGCSTSSVMLQQQQEVLFAATSLQSIGLRDVAAGRVCGKRQKRAGEAGQGGAELRRMGQAQWMGWTRV